jgi:hypothetical protein
MEMPVAMTNVKMEDMTALLSQASNLDGMLRHLTPP